MSVIIDLNLVCVICLQDGELRSVFDQDDTTDLKISDKIMKCSELCIEEESKMPDKICNKCVEDLAAAYRFRQNCEASYGVFSTLQQQEDALANYELEQQQIKIPSGLKIKRIQPESKTYLLPVHVEPETELEQPQQHQLSPEPEEHEEIGSPAVSYDESAEQVFSEEEIQMEEVELDDYFEAEEVLDEHFDEEIIEIKVEKQVAEEETNYQQETDAHEVVIKMEETKDEIIEEDELNAEENTPPMQQQLFSKRGRGRPKKSNDITAKQTTSHSATIKLEVTESNKESTEDFATNTSEKKYSVLKPIAAHKMRKRLSLSPDAKPTKICDICGNSYKYQHALKAHMRRHNNDRPFRCEFCDKAFVSAVELRRHMRVHTGHKPYACQYCDRRFSDFGSRIKHERTHTGERPYNCSTCGKAFAYAHVLSVHLRTHTGEKKFVCKLCGKGFTKKSYLETHTEQHVLVATLAGVDSDITQDATAIKNVAMEECIFTTEYIEDEAESATQMNEEHLEYNENEHTHSNGANEQTDDILPDDYPHIVRMRMRMEKNQEYCDDDDSYEVVQYNIEQKPFEKQ